MSATGATGGYRTTGKSPRKKMTADQDTAPDVMVAVMGATGTGKSTFIKLLTGDENIRVGHRTDSQTTDVLTARYVDEKTSRSVTLIDTPGFDDSRDGVTDTKILEKIVEFLEPKEGEPRRLNGIIYLHRISDPRVGGISRKNLRMFHKLCGDDNLKNVRIVTTYWDSVRREVGEERVEDLRSGAFKALVDAGAEMRRRNTVESARAIMSELIPLDPVTMQIQAEVEAGTAFQDTAAGAVLSEEMRAMQKEHEKELQDLRREMEAAAKANNLVLRVELAEERMVLEQKMARIEEDKDKLSRTLDESRKCWADEQRETKQKYTQLENQRKLDKAERDQIMDELKETKEMYATLETKLTAGSQLDKVERDRLANELRKTKEMLEKLLKVDDERATQGKLKRFMGEMADVLTSGSGGLVDTAIRFVAAPPAAFVKTFLNRRH